MTYFPCLGFPNVTMAPDSSQGPIVVNQDPITQSNLDECLIEPQVMCSTQSCNSHAELKCRLMW